MHVICLNCSHYFAVEISGRRQQADCPHCGTFAGRPDQEGGLVVKLVCRRCGLGYAVDVMAARISLHCSGCAAVPKQRDDKLLRRLAEVYRLRLSPPAAAGARGPGSCADLEDASGRVNLDDMELGSSLVALVPASVALAYCCVPIRYENGVLTVAIAEPVREGVLEDIAFLLRSTVQGAASPRAAVEQAIRRCYGAEGTERQWYYA